MRMSKGAKARAKKTRDRFFIKEWRQAPRFFSLQASTISLAMIATYASIPEKLQDQIPPWLLMTLAVSMLLLGMFGRIVKQRGNP